MNKTQDILKIQSPSTGNIGGRTLLPKGRFYAPLKALLLTTRERLQKDREDQERNKLQEEEQRQALLTKAKFFAD